MPILWRLQAYLCSVVVCGDSCKVLTRMERYDKTRPPKKYIAKWYFIFCTRFSTEIYEGNTYEDDQVRSNTRL